MVSRLRMSGAIPLILLYAFMMWTRTTSRLGFPSATIPIEPTTPPPAPPPTASWWHTKYVRVPYDCYIHRSTSVLEWIWKPAFIEKHLTNTTQNSNAVYVRRPRIRGNVLERNILGNPVINNSGSLCVFRRQTVNSVVKDSEGVLIYSRVLSLSWRRAFRELTSRFDTVCNKSEWYRL
jgi:hypothetical protein